MKKIFLVTALIMLAFSGQEAYAINDIVAQALQKPKPHMTPRKPPNIHKMATQGLPPSHGNVPPAQPEKTEVGKVGGIGEIGAEPTVDPVGIGAIGGLGKVGPNQ